MNGRSFFKIMLALTVLMLMWGCGSGGGTVPGSSTTSKTVQLAQSVKGIDITLILPAGVTVQADAATGETAAGVVTLVGPNAARANNLSSTKYTPSSGSIPGKVRIVFISDTAFEPGAFFTVSCDIAGGVSGITAASFDYEKDTLIVYDAVTGDAITTGVTAEIT